MNEFILPGEQPDKLVTRATGETNPTYGCQPNKRSLSQLINYGLIILDKPANPTSHEVAAWVRKILDCSKTGHGGTLDPAVTGVLPTALEQATRAVRILLKAGKEYIAVLKLHDVVPESKIRETLNEFQGEIYQRPPLKSSVKRVLRVRKIYYLECLEVFENRVLFRVGCEAGTYIRKLCLHPDTNILTDIGSIKASVFFSNQSGIYTLDKGKINNVKPSAVQKIKSPLSLIKITMSSGISFSVTNDHELLMSTKKGYTMIEAKNLQKGDFLVKSLTFPEASNELIISDLLDDNYLVQQDEIKQKCKEAFIAKYGSLRAMNRELNLDRKPFSEKSIHAIKIKHLKLAGIYRSVKRDIYRFKTSKGKIIELRELNEDFFYLLGLIASDGNNSRENKTIRYTRVKFHNKEKVLIDKFRRIYQSLFPDFEIREIKLKKDLWELDIPNSFFATIAASLGIKSPKKHLDIAPIVNVKPELIRAFLRGYFDGDGSVSYKKLKTNCKTRISLFTVYHKEAIDLHKMLLKVGVTNKIFTRTRCDDGKEFDYYEVSIGNISAEKLFIKTIGTNHPKKDKLFKKIEDLDHESAPKDHLHIGLHYIEEIRKKKSQLGKNLGGNLTRILQNSIPITRNFYKKAASIVKLPDLDDCIIEKIVDIQTISGTDYVYDMTVPTTHNFLIETGFVSSNCHDIGVVLGVSGQMEELRRTKSGLFREEDSVSLQDLLDAKILYDETGNEEELRDIIRPFEELFTNYPKIIVRDLAINAICYGAKLAIPGVLKLSKGIQKGTPVVIMSQKGEAIALATALLNTKTILEASSGLCAKIDTVFMARDVYPKSW